MKLTAFVGSVLLVIEGLAYIFAAGAALIWLVQRLLGRATLPDEIQRDGLVLLTGIAVICAVAFVVRLVRGKQRA